jgi:hypothetical protein
MAASTWNAGVPLLLPQSTFGLPNPTVQYASFTTASTSGSGTSTSSSLAASSAGYHIVLLAANVNQPSTAAASVMFMGSTTSAENTGFFGITAGGNLNIPFCPVGFFATLPGDSLAVNTAGGNGTPGITGMITFIYF